MCGGCSVRPKVNRGVDIPFLHMQFIPRKVLDAEPLGSIHPTSAECLRRVGLTRFYHVIRGSWRMNVASPAINIHLSGTLEMHRLAGAQSPFF